MKTMISKKMIISMVIGICLFTLTGCSQSNSIQIANEIHFDLNNITEIEISYDEEDITFLPADGEELVIKEYMSKNRDKYYADVNQNYNSIQIKEGKKPLLKSDFSRYVEVYLPEEYKKTLIITTTDGAVDMTKVNLKISELYIQSTTGTVSIDDATANNIKLFSTKGVLDLGKITGDQITLETTSGSVTCEELIGTVTYTSTSGDIDVKSATGAGNYKANNSGTLKVNYSEVTGDLSFFNKNENIEVTLPENLEFEFEAETKNGSISTPFQDAITNDGRITSAVIGNAPEVTVKVETNNGDIKIGI